MVFMLLFYFWTELQTPVRVIITPRLLQNCVLEANYETMHIKTMRYSVSMTSSNCVRAVMRSVLRTQIVEVVFIFWLFC